jgi:hypothetical protein
MLAPACALLAGLLVVPWVQVRLWNLATRFLLLLLAMLRLLRYGMSIK